VKTIQKKICIYGFVFLIQSLFIISTFCDSVPVYSKHGMVAGPEKHAVKVGLEVLEKGGNAFDAAAAVGFALAVTYPQAGNLGGGGFMVGFTQDAKSVFLDFRETAPKASTRDMYLDDQGNVVDKLSLNTAMAIGVPGTVHGLLSVLQDYGTLSREEILAPAIVFAEQGIKVSYTLNRSLESHKEELIKYESTKKIFFPEGDALPFNTLFVQPELARTLKCIEEEGLSGFYENDIANKIEAFVKKNNGILSKDDLAEYTSKYRDPIQFSYNDYTLILPGLPSSGGIVLAQILQLLQPFDIKSQGYQSAEYIRLLVEAERLAYADRNHHLGDTDFVSSPVDLLLSEDYINQRRALIPLQASGNSDTVHPGSFESPETTHFCVVDQHRNAVAITYTLNGSYGMGGIVDGAGFFMNNEMDDFSSKPGTPNAFGLVQGEKNAIEPGKRMLSSMTPTIVLKNNRFYMTFGTPGGSTIITTNVQIFLNVIEMGMNIREAIDAPRFHHQWLPDEIKHETFAFSPDTSKLLTDMGYTLNEVDSIGFAAGILETEDGLLSGYSDRRGEGVTEGF
jgi:gamma-glutamyltranspeptidase/glutathione hydrolase